MRQPALLILAHQGRSYIKPLRAYLDAMEVLCIVVSSTPRTPQDLQLLEEYSDKVWVTEHDVITEDALFSLLALAQESYQVLSVLATFEAYRLMMAKANTTLGLRDASPDSLALCMDKLACRQALFAASLSKAESYLLTTDEQIQALKNNDLPYFIKPRRGAGSFACFRLNNRLTLQNLNGLKQQMRRDKQFKSIFNGMFDFVAESYIEGNEYSFETLVLNSEVYVIGVHAKYLEESKGTTLEVSNSLPAVNLSNEEQLSGEEFIEKCIRELKIEQGAFHIETRYDINKGQWEIIEINTRMGGALINQSVEIFTQGESFLKLWVELLCVTSAGQEQLLADKLSNLRESYRREKQSIVNGSIFISRYGEPGKTLTCFNTDKVSIQPDIIDMPIPIGTTLPQSHRGIFLCNALWKVVIDELNSALINLPSQFDANVEIKYID